MVELLFFHFRVTNSKLKIKFQFELLNRKIKIKADFRNEILYNSELFEKNISMLDPMIILDLQDIDARNRYCLCS